MTELDITQLNMGAFTETVLVGDGHSLFGPERYDEVGFPEGFLPVHTHVSGEHYKEMIFVNGEPVVSMEAVYHLELLLKIVGALGLKYPSARGRGFQASECVDTIKAYLDEPDEPADEEQAQQLGMGLGVDAYNDAMGCEVTSEDPDNMPT